MAGIAAAQQAVPCPAPDPHADPALWPSPNAPPWVGSDCSCVERYLVPPRPLVYVQADAAAIQHQTNSDVNVALNGTNVNYVLSTNDLNQDFMAAGRLLAGFTLNDCYQIEGLYTAVSTTNNSASVRNNEPNGQGGNGNLFSPFSGFGLTPTLGLDYMNFAQIRYTSAFQAAELNLRRQLPIAPGRLTGSALFGIRYMTVSEQFDFDSSSSVPAPSGAINNFRVTTGNEMIGPQIGALLELYIENRWWVTFEFKGAVLGNQARQTTAYHNVDNNDVATDYVNRASENHTSFVEDLRLMFVYRWSGHLTTELGYQALFLQDVALAPNNLSTDIDVIKFGPAQLNHLTDTIYHGPVGGITLAW